MAFEKYADFKSRSTKNEFWWFFLCNIIVSIGLSIMAEISEMMGVSLLGYVFSGSYLLYSLVVIIPNLSLSIRRLHDTGRSGWFVLLSLIPLIGFIILLVFFAQESQPESNKWGPVPGSEGGLDDALIDFDKDIV